jgi:hypothetical protein
MALTDMTALARSRDLLKEANGLCCELGRRRQELRVWWISHRDELVPEHREIVQAQLETAGVRV